MSDVIRFYALGGLDEYGKNLYCIEINNDIFVLECGIKFPDKSTPGVNFIIADYKFLSENKERVKAIIISHGHEDVMGAIGFLFTKAGLTCPVYGTNITIAFIKRDLSRLKLEPNIKFIEINKDSVNVIANRKFIFFQTAHSIMGSCGVAIESDLGYIVYASDYIVEYNSDNPLYKLDIVKLSEISSKGVLLLLSESVGADSPGFTSPSHKLTPIVGKQVFDAQGRVFFALYDYDIYRLGEVIKMCISNNRKIMFVGDQTNSIVETLNSVGQLVLNKANIVTTDDIFRVRDQDLAIIIMGHRKSLFTQITAICNGAFEDHKIEIKPTDLFVMAAPEIEGIENVTIDCVDDVYRTGCNVVYITNREISTMHAHEDDIRTLLSILHPKYYLPIQGEYRHLLANAMIAVNSALGYSHLNTFVLDNGMVIEIKEVFDERTKRNVVKASLLKDTEWISTGDLLVDGIGVGDVGETVLNDRQKLSEDGVVCMALSISTKTKTVIAGPDIQMRGFVLVKNSEALIKELAEYLVTASKEVMERNGTVSEIQEIVHDKAVKYIRKTTGRDPMILPLIVDIDSVK